MKKLSVFLLLMISMLSLNSCLLGGNSMYFNDDKKADARLEQVLKVMENKDKKGLKAMFSKQALAKANDMDSSIEYIFNLFQGKVTSWNNYGGFTLDETNDYGHITKEAKSFYNVSTDKQKYIFFLLEYNTDTDHPDNVGLYTLRVIKAVDEKTQFGYWQDMKMPGVYKPKG